MARHTGLVCDTLAAMAQEGTERYRDTPAKAASVVALFLLVFLGGIAAGMFGWFPQSFLAKGLEGARNFAGVKSKILRPQVYERSGARVKQPGQMAPGLTALTGLWDHDGDGDLEGGVRLVNASGTTLHMWPVDRTQFRDGTFLHDIAARLRALHGTHVFQNGDLLVNLEYKGSALFDSCGNVQWRLPAESHHTVERASDGTFWIPGASSDLRSTTPGHPRGLPGLSQQEFRIDWLMRVNREGAVKQRIAVLDVLAQNDLLKLVGKQHGVVREAGEFSGDLTHVNDIEPLPADLAAQYPHFDAGDLLVSLRNMNVVLVMDPDTKQVKWYRSEPFSRQHDPDWLGNGWIGVFDNNPDFTKRGTAAGGSRIVLMHPATGTVWQRYPTTVGQHFYTETRGKWQLLANGNMLITESEAGRAFEVTPQGELVWEWVQKPHTEGRIPLLTGAQRLQLSRQTVARWPCATAHASGTLELSAIR
jgi:hypothetical protein